MGGAFKSGNPALLSNYALPGQPTHSADATNNSNPYAGYTPTRSYGSDKNPKQLGANIAAGLTTGLNASLPNISGQIADNPDFANLTGKTRDDAIRSYLNTNFDPFNQMIQQSMKVGGYNFSNPAVQQQVDSERDSLIDRMLRGGETELDLRKKKAIPLPPPVGGGDAGGIILPPDWGSSGGGDSGGGNAP